MRSRRPGHAPSEPRDAARADGLVPLAARRKLQNALRLRRRALAPPEAARSRSTASAAIDATRIGTITMPPFASKATIRP